MPKIHRDRVLLFRTQLTLVLCPLIILPVFIVGYFSYYISYNALHTQSTTNAAKISTLVNQNIDTILTQITQLARIPLYDQTIQHITTYYAAHPEISSLESDNPDSVTVTNFLFNVITRYDSIGSIYIYTSGNVYFEESFDRTQPTVSWKNEPWYRQAMLNSQAPVLLPPHQVEQSADPSQTHEVFSLAQAIVDTQTFRSVGVIVFNIDAQAISDIISTSQGYTDTKFLIYDAQNQWIYRDPFLHDLRSPGEIQRVVRQGESQLTWKQTTYFLSSSLSSRSAWTVIALVPIATLTRDIEQIKQTTVLLICSTLIAFLALFLFLVNRISKQVTQLRRSMKLVEQGNLDARFSDSGSGEIVLLGRAFNHMVARLQRLIQDNYESQLQRQKAELAMLQSQMNPHFLYNTLASFQMIATSEGSKRLAQMSYSLGQLMHYSLAKDELVELGQDLQHVKNYLDLMKEQYEERLHFSIAVPEDLYPYMVPKFILQPLVENAIYHGIDPKIEAGMITLCGYRAENALVLEITDDGVGMPQAELELLQSDLLYESNILKRSKQIGMRNIQAQLQRLFGSSFGLTVSARETGGLKVVLRLPLAKTGQLTALEVSDDAPLDSTTSHSDRG